MNADADITFYISIVSSFLLTVSELLPYIKTIKSNGILELFVSILKKMSNNTQFENGGYSQIINENKDSENIKTLLIDLTNEIRSYKETFITYLNDKKINISIT